MIDSRYTIALSGAERELIRDALRSLRLDAAHLPPVHVHALFCRFTALVPDASPVPLVYWVVDTRDGVAQRVTEDYALAASFEGCTICGRSACV